MKRIMFFICLFLINFFTSCSNSSSSTSDNYEIILSDLGFYKVTDNSGNNLFSGTQISADNIVASLPRINPMKIPSSANPSVVACFKLTWQGSYYEPDYCVLTLTVNENTVSVNMPVLGDSGSGHYWVYQSDLNSLGYSGDTANCSIYVLDKNGGRSNSISCTLHWL